jgi:hypothetical protein
MLPVCCPTSCLGAHADSAKHHLQASGRTGVTVFDLASVMGTSLRMIERHYAP